jgi:hypothetical protein
VDQCKADNRRGYIIKWFKHQADANLNAKLQEVILDHGMEGYGLYWFCIELVAMNVTSTKLNFELEHDARIISRMTAIPVSKVELIMKDFIELDLFSASHGRIQCLKLAKRCDDFTAKAIRQNGLQPLENKEVRQSPTNSEKVPLEDRSKKVEGRTEKNTSERVDLINRAFEHWWKNWPKKVGKKPAQKKWQSMMKKQDSKTITDLTNHICEDIIRRVESLNRGESTYLGFDAMHATTYLNQERFNDDV